MTTTRCELTLRRPLSQSLLAAMRSRFDGVSTPDATVLVVQDVDQAAIRALLVMLWDEGHDVLSMTAG